MKGGALWVCLSGVLHHSNCLAVFIKDTWDGDEHFRNGLKRFTLQLTKVFFGGMRLFGCVCWGYPTTQIVWQCSFRVPGMVMKILQMV